MSTVTPLPTWLASAVGRSAPVESLARYGYQSLVEAAVQAGVARRDAYSTHALFDADKLAHALGGFWRRLRIPLLGVTGSPRHYIAALEDQVRGRIDSDMRKLPLMDRAELGRLHVLGLAALHRADQGLLRHTFDSETARVMIGRLESIGRSYWSGRIPELAAWGPFAGHPSWQAGSLARACHAVLRGQPPDGGLTALDVSVLTLLGATLREVGLSRRCDACFRWAAPGTVTCVEHASIGGIEDGARQRKVERARRLALELYGGTLNSDRPTHGHCVGSVNWLSRTLWRTAVDDEDAIVNALMRQVASLPNLLDAMLTTPERLRCGPLLERLERHIDPLEVRPAAWLDAVELADAWHHWEAWERLPKSAGLTLRTKVLVRRAIEVARRGHLGRNEIARAIGVHPTQISHWLRRGGGDADVQYLAVLLGVRRRRTQHAVDNPSDSDGSCPPHDSRVEATDALGADPMEDEPISEATRRRMLVLVKRTARLLARLRADGLIDSPNYRPRTLLDAGPPHARKP